MNAELQRELPNTTGAAQSMAGEYSDPSMPNGLRHFDEEEVPVTPGFIVHRPSAGASEPITAAIIQTTR